jgi:hypothetical protein
MGNSQDSLKGFSSLTNSSQQYGRALFSLIEEMEKDKKPLHGIEIA